MKSDAQIKADVIAELKWDAEIDETKIGVAVSNGAVTLTGHLSLIHISEPTRPY